MRNRKRGETVTVTLNKRINIWIPAIQMGTILYLLIPTLIYLYGWVKTPVAVLASASLIVATYYYIKRDIFVHHTGYFSINVWILLFSAGLIVLYTWICDIGGFTVSEIDSPWRESVFQDLVDYSWPVVYPKTNLRLIYYFNFWMVPAVIGKLSGHMAANISLLLWFAIGLLLIYLLMVSSYKETNTSICLVSLFLLLFFGGIKIIGFLYSEITNIFPYQYDLLQRNSGWLDCLFNGYSFNWLFRMNLDAAKNIINQTIPVWLTTLLVIMNKDRIENYAYIGLLLLPYAPLPFVGEAVLLIGMALFWEKPSVQVWIYKIRQSISTQNILACIGILPVFYAFFSANSTVSSESGGFMLLPLEKFDTIRIISLLVFYLVEFGIYYMIIAKDHYREPIFYFVLVCMMISPMIEFGKRGGRDFVMNFSLPFLFVLMLWIIKYIDRHIVNQVLSGTGLLLILSIFLASLTPICQIFAKVDYMVENNRVKIDNNWIHTFADKKRLNNPVGIVDYYENFLVEDNSTLWTRIEKQKKKNMIKKDLRFFERNQANNKNQIIEGRYFICPKAYTDKRLIIEGEKVSLRKKAPDIIEINIIDNHSILFSEENRLALDVPDGMVDSFGSIRGYEPNDGSTQRFRIIKKDDGYIIVYGEYALTYTGKKVYLAKLSDRILRNQLWNIVVSDVSKGQDIA